MNFHEIIVDKLAILIEPNGCSKIRQMLNDVGAVYEIEFHGSFADKNREKRFFISHEWIHSLSTAELYHFVCLMIDTVPSHKKRSLLIKVRSDLCKVMN